MSDDTDETQGSGSPAARASGQIEIDICADSPLRIESTADGGLDLTCYRLSGREMVSMQLRFTPGAAANLIGGLYRAVQSGALKLDEQDPPPPH